MIQTTFLRAALSFLSWRFFHPKSQLKALWFAYSKRTFYTEQTSVTRPKPALVLWPHFCVSTLLPCTRGPDCKSPS